MARTATEAANILAEIYEESFGDEAFDKFRIKWPQLREVCDVKRLNDIYLAEIADQLKEHGLSLALFDNSVLVLKECDCSDVRSVPGRLLEKFLPEDDDTEGGRPAENTENDWKIPEE